MISKKFTTKEEGFSVIEVVTIIGIFAITAGYGFSTFREASHERELESAQATLVRSVEEARNKASNGMGGEDYGVLINKNSIAVFQGDSWQGTGTEYLFSPNISSDKNGKEIIFERINGRTSEQVSVILSHKNGEKKIININKNGIETN